MIPTLYHFTCAHGREELGETGLLLPGVQLSTAQLGMPWPAQYVWMTDMATPDRAALGLTSHILRCDRTRFRYRVTDSSLVTPWHVEARGLPPGQREELELAPGARPIHWFVSRIPVSVVLDPIGVAL